LSPPAFVAAGSTSSTRPHPDARPELNGSLKRKVASCTWPLMLAPTQSFRIGEIRDDGSLCGCDNCKRRTGAPFGWSVYFRDEQVGRIEGPLTALVGVGKRWFCPTCGSTLYWKSFGAWKPDQTGFAGGCFADPTLPPPTIAVRCAQGMPWAVYPADCALFDDMPPSASVPLP
jgi:hypothetical protein